ncbi:MAG: hypothetical protein A2145_04010 [candidate division Zixibacteria bacterium RBG_16_40_9]|nr:MAG: hypothetical protein A2145_04010 [candidate division Zixibacteria bacterium RBG_16_40_9]
MPRQLISSGSPFEPIIGFSRAVRVGNQIFVSGTAPIGADGKTSGIGDPYLQTKRCLEIIAQALEKAGAKLENVVRTRTFLVNIEDWEKVGQAHGEFFGKIRPASTMLEVSRLINPEWLVEFEADAVVEREK